MARLARIENNLEAVMDALGIVDKFMRRERLYHDLKERSGLLTGMRQNNETNQEAVAGLFNHSPPLTKRKPGRPKKAKT
jgi:hypothetical protein